MSRRRTGTGDCVWIYEFVNLEFDPAKINRKIVYVDLGYLFSYSSRKC